MENIRAPGAETAGKANEYIALRVRIAVKIIDEREAEKKIERH